MSAPCRLLRHLPTPRPRRLVVASSEGRRRPRSQRAVLSRRPRARWLHHARLQDGCAACSVSPWLRRLVSARRGSSSGWWGGTSSGRHARPNVTLRSRFSLSGRQRADSSERTAASGQQQLSSSLAAARPPPPPPHHPPQPPQLVGRPAWRCRATSRRLRPHAPLAPTPRLCGGRERRDGQKESHREIF